MFVSYNDVLEALHPTIWRTGMEIREEIQKRKGWTSEETTWKTAGVYALLSALERRGLAISRVRENVSPEVLCRRGGRRPNEYLLTEKGFRQRLKQGEKKLSSFSLPQET